MGPMVSVNLVAIKLLWRKADLSKTRTSIYLCFRVQSCDFRYVVNLNILLLALPNS